MGGRPPGCGAKKVSWFPVSAGPSPPSSGMACAPGLWLVPGVRAAARLSLGPRLAGVFPPPSWAACCGGCGRGPGTTEESLHAACRLSEALAWAWACAPQPVGLASAGRVVAQSTDTRAVHGCHPVSSLSDPVRTATVEVHRPSVTCLIRRWGAPQGRPPTAPEHLPLPPFPHPSSVYKCPLRHPRGQASPGSQPEAGEVEAVPSRLSVHARSSLCACARVSGRRQALAPLPPHADRTAAASVLPAAWTFPMSWAGGWLLFPGPWPRTESSRDTSLHRKLGLGLFCFSPRHPEASSWVPCGAGVSSTAPGASLFRSLAAEPGAPQCMWVW